MSATSESHHESERALWARYRMTTSEGIAPEPSLGDLAAWLEGSLPPEQTELVEAAIAGNHKLRLLVQDCGASQTELRSHQLRVPADVLQAAYGLVSDGAGQVEAVDHPVVFSFVRIVRWSMAAAAAIGISLAGFQLGSGAAASELKSDAALLAELTFGTMESELVDSSNGSGDVPLSLEMWK